MADPRPKLEDPFGLVGTTLEGQYRVEKVVGEGGFGVVYKGWHQSLEQPIAIKALKVLADDLPIQDALFAKFKDEAKLLYTLSQASLNIVRSIDFGATNAPNGLWAPYMILEWLAGRSLADDLADRRHRGMRGRTLDETMTLLEPMAEGLGVAHQQRVAHRDIKPANFFLLDGLSPSGAPRAKVLDFGIAKIVRDNELPGTRSPFASFTWLYAAPEQLDSRVGATGLATDVYAFALLFTELLTDRVPVEGRDVVSLMKAATDPTMRPTPKQRGVAVPDAVEVVCRRALAVDPKARFATIGDLWAALVAARRPASSPGAGTPSQGVMSAVSPSAHTTTPGSGPPPTKGVFIPTGVRVPSGPPVGTAPPGYAPQPQPSYAILPGSAPMMVYPQRMTPPPTGPFYPQRPVPNNSSQTTITILIAVAVVFAVLLGSCAVLVHSC